VADGEVEEQIPLAPAEKPTDNADILVKRLLPELDEETATMLATMATSDYHDAIMDRTGWEDMLASDDKLYHGILPKKTIPWPGCSNLNVPLVMTGIETLKPRLVEAVLGDDPPIMARQTESQDEDLQERVELFLNHQVQTRLDIEDLVVDSAHRFLTPGIVIGKTRWVVNERRKQYVRSYTQGTDFDTILADVLQQDVALETEQTDKGDTPQWKITVRTPRNREREIFLTLQMLPTEVQAMVDRVEVIYEGPDVTLLDAEDFIVPVKGGQDIQKLPWCMQRLWLDQNALRTKVRQGRFYEDAIQKLIDGDTPEGDNLQLDSSEVRTIRSNVEGTEEFGASSVRATEYTVLECYYRYDLDEDGLDEEIMFWVCPERGDLLLGWDYLDNVYATGRRPFRIGRYFPLPGRTLGLSFPQIVKPIQEEINTIHNQRVDNGTIRNSCTGFYPTSWTQSPQDMRVGPGQMVPVERPQDMVFPNWNGGDAWGQNEEALLMQMFERLTGINDLSLGRQPNRVGATRTATGVASLLSEAGLRFKNAMTAFQRFWRDIFADILALDQQYLPPGVEFRVTGRFPELIRINSRADIAGKFDVRISATSETLNRQLLREDATAKFQFAANPLLLQLGITGKKALRRHARRFLLAYGETDPDMSLELDRDQIIRTPQQEEAMWTNRDYSAKPSIAEDINGHLQSHQALLANPAARAMLGPEGLKAAEQHVAETVHNAQMQAAIMAMQQKAGPSGAGPQAGTQPGNAQTGRMVGPMAGGRPQSPASMGGTPAPAGAQPSG
jgi:hypothetical protein